MLGSLMCATLGEHMHLVSGVIGCDGNEGFKLDGLDFP